MDPEQRQLLTEMLEATKQNNAILRRMQRQALWAKFFNLLYWIAIIAIAVWSYNLIKPYLGTLTSLMNQIEQFKNIDISKLPR